jgi:erythromycin esterase
VDSAVVPAGAAAGWTRHEIGIPTTAGAHSVVVTLGIERGGTAWFDAFELLLGGQQVTQLSTGSAPAAAHVAWLARHTQPLRSVEPARHAAAVDDADLALFDRIVGDAHVVALGESTHGTREFFQAKHRLLEYLVRRRGFSVFAIEANQLAVERINRYVQGGEGTTRDVMRVMFRVWNTEEVAALIEWMRAFNAGNPSRRLRFVGYDMQDHVLPMDSLRAFLGRADSGLAARLRPLDAYRAQRSWSTPQLDDSVRRDWARQATGIHAEVSGRRAAWLAVAATAADSLRVEWAVQAANLLRQAALGNETLNVPDRDSLMAANLDWALRVLTPGQRAVVWAHGIHVSRGGDSLRSFYRGATMGAQLGRWYGDGYRAFSLLTYEGSYSATKSLTNYEMTTAAALPAPLGSLEYALRAVSRPRESVGLTLDLRAARGDTAARWLDTPQRLRHVGYAAYDFAFDLAAVFPLEFDGVVFVERSSASRLLP